MSYQVIARKYRPQTLPGRRGPGPRDADARQRDRAASGSPTPTCSAARAAPARRRSPASSPSASTARAARRWSSTDGDPRRGAIAEGRHLDVIEIDGASNNGVEQVRDLRETCRLRAGPGRRYKIYIIDEVHMLSTAAFNALLKTLEEPPAHVKFVFATTDPEKVPAHDPVAVPAVRPAAHSGGAHREGAHAHRRAGEGNDRPRGAVRHRPRGRRGRCATRNPPSTSLSASAATRSRKRTCCRCSV